MSRPRPPPTDEQLRILSVDIPSRKEFETTKDFQAAADTYYGLTRLPEDPPTLDDWATLDPPRTPREPAELRSKSEKPRAHGEWAAPWKQHDPLPLSLAYARALDSAKVAAIRGSSTAWWAAFWAKSSIEIPSEGLLQFFWNSAQYVMGASSRPGKVVPSIFVSCTMIAGIWVAFSKRARNDCADRGRGLSTTTRRGSAT